MTNTILAALAYWVLVLFGIGAAYSIRRQWREWREQQRDGDTLHRRMCAREMRRKIGL